MFFFDLKMCSQCYYIDPPCVISHKKNRCNTTERAALLHLRKKTFGMGVLMHRASQHNQKRAKNLM